ncbi:MAG TPA: aminodeoxychorismate lyase [Pseudomonadales bacterium]|nr:aminodeoxychorismate lyase [Pseudomonadales bacterium]
MTPIISVDGNLVEQVSALDRGLAYGDGLFETILVRDGQPVFLDAHFGRLSSSALRLNIPLHIDIDHSCQHFLAQVQAQSDISSGVLKLILTRGCGGRGYAPPEQPQPTLIWQWHQAPALPSSNNLEGIALYACECRLPSRTQFPGLKSLNRLDNVMARAEFAGSRYAEGLMLDFDGHVIEGTMTNLFWVRAGRLYTPSLADVGVHGIMRAQIMQRFETISVKAKLDSILAADELFLCNSVNGIWPVIEFQQARWPIGSLTRRIQSEFSQFL